MEEILESKSEPMLEPDAISSSHLKVNDYVYINGLVCRIREISTSKTGKHGTGKVLITATDIFTLRSCDFVLNSNENVLIPIVKEKNYSLINIIDGFLSLKTEGQTTKDNVKVPGNSLGRKLTADFESGKQLIVNVISALGNEGCVSYKEAE